jgi:hypothetical protein
MGYNKPITARIQHSTNKGMKVQDPLLDLGSAVKKTEIDYSPDEGLMSGVENSKFVDVAEPLKEGMDSIKEGNEQPESNEEPPKATAKQTKGQTDKFGPSGSEPNPGLYAAIVKKAKKK